MHAHTHTDKQTDRQADRQTDRQANRQTGRQTDRPTLGRTDTDLLAGSNPMQADRFRGACSPVRQRGL